MNQPIIDYYRCPENLADVQLAGRISKDPGYFCFVPETICYRNSSSPLDPNEVIINLRTERYWRNGFQSKTPLTESALLRTLYYWLRPFLPVAIRKHLQRVPLSDWKTIRFPQWPVDRTVELILERLLALSMKAQGIDTIPFVWFWPEGATSCAIMTHDVEQLAGRDFCSRLMDLDDSMEIKSSFDIVPEDRYPVPDSFLEEIRHRGFELGVHDLNHDGRLFSSRGDFGRRAERINEYGRKWGALGFRSGGLYRNQEWYDALEFSYDMSVPNVGHLESQRGGCCSLMPFFIGRVLELPLTTVQDYSLFHILNEYSIGLWKQQLAKIVEHHGLASFLVHPDYVIEQRARSTYQALLEHLVRMREEKKIWITLPREVDRWWRERSQMRVVSDGGRWRIEGKGNLRARLAFATLIGDELAFSIEA